MFYRSLANIADKTGPDVDPSGTPKDTNRFFYIISWLLTDWVPSVE